MIGMQMTKKKSKKSISSSTFNRNQDPDGEDESLLGDQGELKQKPTYNEEEAKHDLSDKNRETLPKASQ
jgi:hypothetical protein